MSVYYPKCRAVLSVTFDGFGEPDSKPTILEVQPRSARVCLNSYKEADTFDLTFDVKRLPISPDQIRGAGVQIYMYHTEGPIVDIAGGFAEVASALGITAGTQYLNRARMQMAGLIDQAEMDGGKDGATFHVSGRDYTGLMLDRQWRPQDRIKTGVALDAMVQSLVDEATQAAKIGRTLTVRWEGGGRAPPIVGTVHNVKTKKRGITPAGGGKNYWDVIYNLAIRHGFIAFVRGFDVIITRPSVLTAASKSSIAKMVYGRNLESLQISRKLGKETVPQIVVRSYDPKTRKLIEGKFPDKGEKAKTGVGTDKDAIKSFTVPGVSDSKTLRDIAENAYESIARGEGSVHFSTKHLKDLDGQIDLLALRAGAAVAVGFDAFLPDTMLNSLEDGQRFDRLVSLGYSAQVARVIASNFKQLDYFRRPLYVKEVILAWESKSGIQIEVEAQNFISTVRDEKRK